MKRIFSIVVAAFMLFSVFAVSASAVSKVTFVNTVPKNIGTLVLKMGANSTDAAEVFDKQNIYSLYPAPEGTNFCLKGNAWARYDFDLEMSGRYALAFEFVARTGSDRAIDYAVDNPDDRVFVKLDPCADNNDHRIAIVELDLTAGSHSIWFCSPTGFDDSTIKSCDFYGFELYLKEASGSDETSYSEPDETSSPETEANMEDETKAPANGGSENNTTVSTDKTDGGSSDNSSDNNSAKKTPPAPDTSDASILLFAVIAISSGAVLAVNRRRG